MIKVLMLTFIAGVLPLALLAQNVATNQQTRIKQYNIERSGLALEGYDPLSYFSGTPKKGSATYSYAYNGITYRFVNKQNLDTFKANPSKYEPAYGGWCAYAMGASGEKVEVDPETYKIKNGVLYLFYNSYFNNTLPKWNADETNLNKKADANWLKFIR